MTLIIGCGNPDRGDDAAGILVARRLRQLGFNAVEHNGGGLELLDLWRGAEDVILVDAMLSSAKPGEISVWDATERAVGAQKFCCSTHGIGPTEAIELARALGQLPQRMRVYGIEAARFQDGQPPCPEVLSAVDRVVVEIARIHPPEPAGCAIRPGYCGKAIETA